MEGKTQGLGTVMESMEEASFTMYRHICATLAGASTHVCDLDHAVAHTRLISAIHDSGTIQVIPDALLQHEQVGGVAYRRVPQLTQALQQAHDSGTLLSEAGFGLLLAGGSPLPSHRST